MLAFNVYLLIQKNGKDKKYFQGDNKSDSSEDASEEEIEKLQESVRNELKR